MAVSQADKDAYRLLRELRTKTEAYHFRDAQKIIHELRELSADPAWYGSADVTQEAVGAVLRVEEEYGWQEAVEESKHQVAVLNAMWPELPEQVLDDEEEEEEGPFEARGLPLPRKGMKKKRPVASIEELLRDIKSLIEAEFHKSSGPGEGPEKVALIKRAKEGDRDALDEVIRRVDKMVWDIVHKESHGYSRHDQEDLHSEGIRGVLEAIATYDPEKGVPFTTWAYTIARSFIRRARDEIVRHSKAAERELKRRYLGVRQIAKRGRELRPEKIPEPVRFVIRREDRERLLRAMDDLPPKQKRALELAFGFVDGEGKSVREIAKDLEISHTFAMQLIHKGIETLKKHPLLVDYSYIFEQLKRAVRGLLEVLLEDDRA